MPVSRAGRTSVRRGACHQQLGLPIVNSIHVCVLVRGCFRARRLYSDNLRRPPRCCDEEAGGSLTVG